MMQALFYCFFIFVQSALLVDVIGAQRLEHAPALPSGSELFFYDDFAQPSLEESWFWVREDPTHWTLSARPGYLRIWTQDGTIHGEHTAANILLREAPAPPSIVSTAVTFAPTENFQEAALLLYADDDNYVKLSRLYNDVHASGNILLFLQEVDGERRASFTTTTTQTQAVMRLHATDHFVVGSYQDESGKWVSVGAILLDSETSYPFVGLTAHNGIYEGNDFASIAADFDFIILNTYQPRSIYLPVVRSDGSIE